MEWASITVKSQNRLHRLTCSGQIVALPTSCVNSGLKTVCLHWNSWSELLATDHVVLLDGRIYRSHGCNSVQWVLVSDCRMVCYVSTGLTLLNPTVNVATVLSDSPESWAFVTTSACWRRRPPLPPVFRQTATRIKVCVKNSGVAICPEKTQNCN